MRMKGMSLIVTMVALLAVSVCGSAQPNPPMETSQIRSAQDVQQHAAQIMTTLQIHPRSLDRQSLVTAYQNLGQFGDEVAQSKARSLLQRAMLAEGLYEPFAAQLDTAAELTDTGTGNVPSATGSLQPQAKGVISWESAHFGEQHPVDFSFGGQFGYAPVYTLVNLINSANVPLPPKARPMFQQGFIWSIRPQANIHLPQFVSGQLSSELGVFASVGQTILTSNVTAFTQSNSTVTATLVSDNVGNGALFAESGLQFRLYNADLDTTHRDKSFLSPAFFLESGFKLNERFKAEGDLAGYDSPQNRAFVRFMVSLNKITNSRGTTDPKEPFSVDFGIDYEFPVSEARVPAATRIVIRGSLDVLKLLKGSQ